MPRPNPRALAAAPSETALLLGLLGDLLRWPLWLTQVLRGRAGAALLLRPARRLLDFATAARMTAVLILLNLLGFAWEIAALGGGLGEAAFLRRFALRPSDLAQGNLLPVLTHLFAHAGWAHLLGNMLTLLVFGRAVERRLGPLPTVGAYLGAAVVSTALSLAAQVALGRDTPTLGASGAVAGLVALGILLAPFTLTFEALLPMPLLLVGWLAIAADLAGVTRGRSDGIDHFAHLGGYLSVLLVALLVEPAQRRALRVGLWLNLATLAAALALWLLQREAFSSTL